MDFLSKFIEEKILNNANQIPAQIYDQALSSLNPLGAVIDKSARNAIGSVLLNNNKTLLSEERNSDGSFKTNLLDPFLGVTAEKKRDKGLNILNTREEYKPLTQRDYEFTDENGNLKSNKTIDRAKGVVGSEEYLNYEAKDGDLSKIDLDTISPQKLTILTQNQDNKDTILRLSPGTNVDSMDRNSLQGLAEELTEKQNNKRIKENPLNKAKLAESAQNIETAKATIRQGDERTKLDILGLQNELALGQSDIDLKKATALMQADQARLDREYLDRRDQRDYNYRIRQDDQERMDDIFKLLLGASTNLF